MGIAGVPICVIGVMSCKRCTYQVLRTVQVPCSHPAFSDKQESLDSRVALWRVAPARGKVLGSQVKLFPFFSDTRPK